MESFDLSLTDDDDYDKCLYLLRQPVMEGYLIKEGHIRKNWKRRFFSMDKKTGIITYYLDHTKEKVKGKFRIDSGCSSVEDCRGPWMNSDVPIDLCFVVEAFRLKGSGTDSKLGLLLIQANDLMEKRRWMSYIHEIICNSSRDVQEVCHLN